MKGNGSMQDGQERRMNPKLKELVMEASQALARLDADRLEELSLSCAALNRNLPAADDAEGRKALALDAGEAVADMAVFARVLEATQANLNVMVRLREMRGDRLDYGDRRARGWMPTESSHGHD